jgi:hypothetical protein
MEMDMPPWGFSVFGVDGYNDVGSSGAREWQFGAAPKGAFIQ